MPIRGQYIIPRHSWFYWYVGGVHFFKWRMFKGLRLKHNHRRKPIRQ